jgi:hypothetical protein
MLSPERAGVFCAQDLSRQQFAQLRPESAIAMGTRGSTVDRTWRTARGGRAPAVPQNGVQQEAR